MLTDVSTETATRMRKISSGAQGAMIAMSLLQRNVMGLAFSLIFLQFSGFLKISLAVAGVISVLAGLVIGFKALATEGLKLSKFNDQLFILTGGLQAGSLVMDAARLVAEKYGLLIDDLAKFKLAGLVEGVSNTTKEFDTFGGLLALVNLGLLKGVKDSDALIKKWIDLKESGKSLDEILAEFGLTSDELREKL